jgi:hypothetical protein
VLNKIKKLLMKKEEPTNEEVFEQQIQAREDVEIAADNMDQVLEPDQLDENFDGREEAFDDLVDLADADQIEPTEEEIDEMNNPSASDPEYLEYSSEVVGYENREHQWDTYRIISNFIGEEDSILDFGCARGDFEKFYQSEFEDSLDYTGVDMNQQLIDAGNKVYNEEVDLLCSDWFKLKKDLKKDWSINIGSNNLRYDTDAVKDDELYLYDTIRTMMEHSEKGSIILLASDQSDIDDGLISYNAGEVFNWAQKEFGIVAMDHSFSKDLFTLIIYKN